MAYGSRTQSVFHSFFQACTQTGVPTFRGIGNLGKEYTTESSMQKLHQMAKYFSRMSNNYKTRIFLIKTIDSLVELQSLPTARKLWQVNFSMSLADSSGME